MGYVLNRDKGQKSDGEDSDDLTLEEKIEEERALLVTDNLTPVTFETFTKWKADRALRKEAELEARIIAEEAKGRKDRGQMAFLSGRALFNFNPDLFDDDEDADDDDFNEEETKTGQAEDEEDEGPLYGDDAEERKEEAIVVDIDTNMFAGAA
jgi:hypothetical protein